MKLKDLCSYLDEAIPLSFQETYDNSGLQVGLPDKEIRQALLTLDVTEEVLDEAVREDCDVIISHHPVIFGSIRKLTGNTANERILHRAIKSDIAIYSAHTNLDAIFHGVSFKMAEKAGLENVKVLSPLKNRLLKLVTFIPESHLEKVSDAVFDAGAGGIGNYDRCGFSLSGTGTFRAGEGAKPFAGERGKIHYENEVRFETILYAFNRERVLKALLDAHPYEEVAYDLYQVENDNFNAGSGCVGNLKKPLTEEEFLTLVSEAFESEGVRYSGKTGRTIKTAALCGGAGSFLLNEAIASGADAFITGDLKYHTFLEAGNRILLIDCGHYETEKFSVEILYDLIIKKFAKFALRFSKTNTNPINYL